MNQDKERPVERKHGHGEEGQGVYYRESVDYAGR